MKATTTFFLLFAVAAFGQSPSITNIVEAGLGILSGSGLIEQIPDFPECLFAAQSAQGDLSQVIADLQKKTPLAIIDAVQVFTQKIVPSIQQCAPAGKESIAVARAIFGDLTNLGFIESGVKRLLVNYQQVFQDITGAIADKNEGNWLMFGIEVGDLLGLFLGTNLGDELANSTQGIISDMQTQPVTLDKSEQILVGFVKGLGIQKNVTDLNTCESSVENFTAYIEAAQQYYNAGGLVNIEKAIILVGNAMQQLGIAEYACQASANEVKSYLNQFAEDFSNKAHDAVAIELLATSIETYGDLTTIITDYQNEQWESYGESLGEFVIYVHDEVVKVDKWFA